MNSDSRYLAGVDIGSTMVRGVLAKVGSDGKPVIVGVSQYENSGMKKGVVSNLNSSAKAIDEAVAVIEKFSGVEVDRATFSINGSHLLSTKVDGTIALTSSENRVTDDDLDRIQEVAALGRVPANRDTLAFIPYDYILDGQSGITDPFEMSGSRLEVRANMVTAMQPHAGNIEKVADQVDMSVNRVLPSVMAAATAVLTEKQIGSGVAVVDLGATTTSVAIYENGDLQHLRVIPMGGDNITNDLAICLKITPDIAEEIKLNHAYAGMRGKNEEIMVKRGSEHYSFNTTEIDEVVDARLEEIFELIRNELKAAGFDKQLPSGVVLVGGGANMKNIATYSKVNLELASQVGEIKIESAVTDEYKKPEFAAAVGLMLEDMQEAPVFEKEEEIMPARGIFAKIFGKSSKKER